MDKENLVSLLSDEKDKLPSLKSVEIQIDNDHVNSSTRLEHKINNLSEKQITNK